MSRQRPIRRPFAVLLAAIGCLFVLLALFWSFQMSLPACLLFAAFTTLPIAILAWFIVSLLLYLRGKKRQDEDLSALKWHLTVSLVLLLFLLVITVALIGFFALAIAYM